MTGKIWLNCICIFSVYNQNTVLEGASGITVQLLSLPFNLPVRNRKFGEMQGQGWRGTLVLCMRVFSVSNPAKSRGLELGPLGMSEHLCGRATIIPAKDVNEQVIRQEPTKSW